MNSFGQRPAIDLTRYHFAIPYKDLMIFGSWVWSQEQEDEEPCLVILPRYRREGFIEARDMVASLRATRFGNTLAAVRLIEKHAGTFVSADAVDATLAYVLSELSARIEGSERALRAEAEERALYLKLKTKYEGA